MELCRFDQVDPAQDQTGKGAILAGSPRGTIFRFSNVRVRGRQGSLRMQTGEVEAKVLRGVGLKWPSAGLLRSETLRGFGVRAGAFLLAAAPLAWPALWRVMTDWKTEEAKLNFNSRSNNRDAMPRRIRASPG
jgi:hypothetical protein